MSKVIDSMWFNTAQGTFGIILAEDETTGERKLYYLMLPDGRVPSELARPEVSEAFPMQLKHG